jgi:ribosomal protein L11 methyltransferase
VPYQQISATVPREKSDIISDELTAQAALAITLASANSEEVFQLKDERPLWEKTIIKALFADDWPIKITMQELKKKFPDISWELEAIADEDWVRKTQENFPAQNFANKLWVLSSWEDINEFPGQKIRIDPGLAFGTGTHDTTKLCLEFLANNAPANKTVIDYGCGSGILALGALALGAKKVGAIDHDAQALEATRNNAQLNELRDGSLEIFHDNGQKNPAS